MVRCTALWGGAVACPRSGCLASAGCTAPDSFTPPSFVTDLLQPELC